MVAQSNDDTVSFLNVINHEDDSLMHILRKSTETIDFIYKLE